MIAGPFLADLGADTGTSGFTGRYFLPPTTIISGFVNGMYFLPWNVRVALVGLLVSISSDSSKGFLDLWTGI